MKKIQYFILVVFIVATSSCNEDVVEKGDRGYHVKVGDKVENIDLRLINDSVISLEKMRGKVVVLQFTASWCSVCRKEMPFLEEEVWQKYKNDDFILIGVDYNEPIDKVIAFAEKMNITYPIAIDPGGSTFMKFSYKNSGVTRNVVIDKDGNIAYLTRLFNREEFDSMKEKIKVLISE